MKKFVIFVVITIISINLFSIVNGELTEINNQKILKVWGTHYERGYAEGFLLGTNIKEMFENYIFPKGIMKFIGMVLIRPDTKLKAEFIL